MRKGSHETGSTHVMQKHQACPSDLEVLCRPWPIFAGLGRDHFIDKRRSETEVTAKPLEKAKGHRRQEGTEKGVVRHRIDAG